MREHHLTVARTARYYTLGEINEHTKEVWIVLHGYAQLAADFIHLFDGLNDGHRMIVAPEGLNRFYAKGFGGKPAATWMTSEDRDNEIADYIAYLNTLYETLNLKSFSGKVVLLGFSQGVATASRWLATHPAHFHHFVICSGEIAREMQEPVHPTLQQIPITYLTGNSDPLITPEKHEAYKTLMNQLQARMITFNGGHIIHKDSLITLANNLFAQ